MVPVTLFGPVCRLSFHLPSRRTRLTRSFRYCSNIREVKTQNLKILYVKNFLDDLNLICLYGDFLFMQLSTANVRLRSTPPTTPPSSLCPPEVPVRDVGLSRVPCSGRFAKSQSLDWIFILLCPTFCQGDFFFNSWFYCSVLFKFYRSLCHQFLPQLFHVFFFFIFLNSTGSTHVSTLIPFC